MESPRLRALLFSSFIGIVQAMRPFIDLNFAHVIEEVDVSILYNLLELVEVVKKAFHVYVLVAVSLYHT